MEKVRQLSSQQCTFLAVQYATTSNVEALRVLTALRSDAFTTELILRILLTCLPEALEPSAYTSFLDEVIHDAYNEVNSMSLDFTPIENVNDARARRKVRKLQILPLRPKTLKSDIDLDPLSLFIIHRAHRIDKETGLVELIKPLVEPFIDRLAYVRTWFISCVLPLLRLGYEYYPQERSITHLESIEKLRGQIGVYALLNFSQEALKREGKSVNNIARDIRGLVGPWMCGFEDRSYNEPHTEQSGAELEAAPNETGHDWELVFTWLVKEAPKNFLPIVEAVEEWDGPGDVDLEDYAPNGGYLEESYQEKLERRYAQAVFASVYAVEANDKKTIEGAHSLLVRLASLMDFEPPPELATSVDLLPRIDSQSSFLRSSSIMLLQPNTLLNPSHPLTTPQLETFSLLQILVYSAYIAADLGFPISVTNAAKLHFHGNEEEQTAVVQKLLRTQVSASSGDDDEWILVRSRLTWLWNWGIRDTTNSSNTGAGILGSVKKPIFDTEVLKAYLTSAQLALARRTFLEESPKYHSLSARDIELIVLETVLQLYDSASNGNRTRGSMKKASDILSAFHEYYGGSSLFRRCEALVAATHSMSFYSLILQHGVPFKPVSIRVSNDPLFLLKRMLLQNPKSYTKLDDLISIGRNLLLAGQMDEHWRDSDLAITENHQKRIERAAEYRVIGMAVEAALEEGDFETAYSYVVNRLRPDANRDTANENMPLSPTLPDATAVVDVDDITWRAAFLAGSYQATENVYGADFLRHLEQRMELLSHALLLAPPKSLQEALEAWQACEREVQDALDAEAQDEETHNDIADGRLPGSFVNTSIQVQPRREIGRGAVEEAPMGLFDVARGAAAAFGRNTFAARGSAKGSAELSRPVSSAGSFGYDGEDGDRVRKRDMVANAVTGSLASGLGWVLGKSSSRVSVILGLTMSAGAKPVSNDQQP